MESTKMVSIYLSMNITKVLWINFMINEENIEGSFVL